jgi:thiol-disulfide isomerase/thioredoxin
LSPNLFSFLFVVTFLLCFSNIHSVYAQASKIEPESIKQGTKILLTYNPKVEGAKLSANDEIYISAMTAASDGLIKSSVSRMEKANDLFKYEFSILPNVYAIQVEFVTLRKWDDKASIKKKVTRPDGSPAKNAAIKVGKDYLEAFNQEISLYPDNYQAYKEKWFAATFVDKEKVKAIVVEDMKKLTAVKEETADLLYALNFGYLLLGEEPKSRETIKLMATKYSASPLLEHALSDYSYQVFAQQIKGEGEKEIDKLTREFIQKYANSEVARGSISGYADSLDFPLITTEFICQKWMQEEPNHPRPLKILAQAYKTHQQKLDLAASLIEKSLSLFLQGYDRLYISRTGGAAAREIPSAYLVSAEIALLRQKYADALAAIKAAQMMVKETTAQSHLLEAQVWEKVNDSEKVESAYLEAARSGSDKAEQALQALYVKKNGNAEGFADYLAKAKSKSSPSTASRKEAKAFKAESVDGKPYDLSALRGKVVVVNFWFIGCAPCRVEMPGLNQLVTEFKDKDVVFLALALDSADDLRKFLKTMAFNYTIIAAAETISNSYEVSAFPTHIIIDKKGQIAGRLTGGSDKRHEQIRPLIQRALAEQ